ncbi:ead/Ea22-like family protein [Kluyvera sichuanensis]|uniref:ead/Ea22-like family protein n=1 Tax=Kluyvera sichuanensis TaxID=2725494 RepID=UPI0039F55B79
MNDITALMATMKAAAEKASNGEWVKESGDGWEATCSANDQANGGFIIAHFEGPDAAANREFVQAANPANVRALVEALEKAQQDSDGVAGMAEHYETTISMLRGRITELEESHAQVIQSRDHYKRMSEEGLKRIVTAAASDVLAERQRQISIEGWKPEHDDEHVEGQLSDAAACYALFATDQRRPVPAHWPWSDDWWKQRGQRRDLVRAGALIIAEIERLDRAAGIQVIEGEGQCGGDL